jgi:fructose-bisphosphate aldolase class II
MTETSPRSDCVRQALEARTAVPAFNIPYLPMMEPVVAALKATESFGMIVVARLEWVKFESGSIAEIERTYRPLEDRAYTWLHLDHVPVIDEDDLEVDYEADIAEALRCGYDSVMVDGSRLDFEGNAAATQKIVRLAHERGRPVEAELGAILGHEAGPLPPYEELFRSRRGFTDPEEARRFVERTGVDWLSVAIGNIHGAISAAKKAEKKIAARLDVEHLGRIREATGVPLVLHGGTGIPASYIREAIAAGIAKINIATAIRQPYEAAREQGAQAAREAVYAAACSVLADELGVAGSAAKIQA